MSNEKYLKENKATCYSQGSVRENGLGVYRLVRSFTGKSTFSRSWEEDLDSIISVFESMARMCLVTTEDKLNGSPIMLFDDALVYFSSNFQGYSAYNGATIALQNWYSNVDKEAKILKIVSYCD